MQCKGRSPLMSSLHNLPTVRTNGISPLYWQAEATPNSNSKERRLDGTAVFHHKPVLKSKTPGR
eukprot:5224070-Amphidinium_carterae.1